MNTVTTLISNATHSQYWQGMQRIINDFSGQLELLNHQFQPRFDIHSNLQNVVQIQHELIDLLCKNVEKAFAVDQPQSTNDTTEALPTCKVNSIDSNPLRNTVNETSKQLTVKDLELAFELQPQTLNSKRENQEFRIINGRPVLTIHIQFGNNIWGNWNYNFSDKCRICTFIDALTGIATWANLWKPEYQGQIDLIKNKITKTPGTSARVLGIIKDWPLAWIFTYKNKFEFRLHPELAEQLQIFTDTFNTEKAAA